MLVAWLIIARSAQIAASILIAGIFAFEVVMLGAGSDDLNELERQFSQLALWSLLVALLSALLWFSLEVTSMSGLSFAKAFSGTAWRTLLFETEFGRVWQVRLGLSAVTFALAAFTLTQDQMRRGLGCSASFCSSRSPGLATLRLPECNRSVGWATRFIFAPRAPGSADWHHWQFF